MFKRIAHVCLNVRDLKVSIDYYTRLGFSVKFMFTRKGKDYGAYLEIAPQTFIEMFEGLQGGAAADGGIMHFCLETDDLDLLMQKLTAANVPYTPKKIGCDNTWQIWLTDPDGNSFEVHQYTSKSAQYTGAGPIEADW